MECIKMSYKGFQFPVNVSSIEADYSKKVKSVIIPRGSARAQEICFNPTVIKGAGCFTGRDANEKANMLMTAFQSKGSAYLFSPVFSPMRMYFSKLKMSADSEKGCIEYRFTFIEEVNSKGRRYDFGYTFALPEENLYDVANRCGVRVEKLVEANGVKDLFSLNEGDKIWLK